MSRTPPPRDLFKIIFNNFINSLRPKRSPEKLMGTDYLGNKYYELKADLVRKRRGGRWFVPPKEGDVEQEVPPEWLSWLKCARQEPPTEEEIKTNLEMIKMKRENAAKLAEKYGLVPQEDNTIGTFPKRLEYEQIPGKPPDKQFNIK